MRIRVDATAALERLLAQEDTDGDRKITVEDRGPTRFVLEAEGGATYEVLGTYALSNLLQELVLAGGEGVVEIDPDRIFERPTARISRQIREEFWDGLTRRIDEENLTVVLVDTKSAAPEGGYFLYVAATDEAAFEELTAVAARHPDWNLQVVRLPERVTGEYVRNLDGKHGLLALASTPREGGGREGVPFVVPGGRFNEMFGWDSYFIALGLLHDGRVELARAMVDNHVYEIEHYGAILNANRTYFLTRSQPPFLTSMALAVHGHLPKSDANRGWLERALAAAVREYKEVWTGPDRLTDTGLSRYKDSGYGAPPEPEPGHYATTFRAFAAAREMDPAEFESGYRSGAIKDEALDEYFVHDRALRESGHDTSYRLEDRCADLATVDLNSLLYKIETDLARAIETGLVGESRAIGTSSEWRQTAERRKALMDRYLWDDERGLYFDYDVVKGERIHFVAATTLYPLWAGVASSEQASRVVEVALPLLEAPGGLAASTEASRGPITAERPPRQWDYPHGWAPHQVLAWGGLGAYGFDEAACRLAYRWLYTITSNAARYNGTVPEKFDVVARTHQVFAEYGNVGTKFDYITREGFGWTNASYQLGLDLMSPDQRDKLDRLVAPEWVFA